MLDYLASELRPYREHRSLFSLAQTCRAFSGPLSTVFGVEWTRLNLSRYATVLDEQTAKVCTSRGTLFGSDPPVTLLTGATIPAEWAIIHQSSYPIKELYLRDFKSPFSVHFLGVTCGENFSHRVK